MKPKTLKMNEIISERMEKNEKRMEKIFNK